MAPRISSPSKMQQQKVAPSSKESSKKLRYCITYQLSIMMSFLQRSIRCIYVVLLVLEGVSEIFDTHGIKNSNLDLIGNTSRHLVMLMNLGENW